jgi:iron complex outermembrane receptor protein
MRYVSLLVCTYLLVFNSPSALAEDITDVQSLLNMSLEELLKVEVQVGPRTSSKTYSKIYLPIDIITADQLRKTGYGEFPKALNQLLSSFTYCYSTINDLTDDVRPFSLNGMHSDQVLVLINGKRFHQSSTVFVNDSQMVGPTSVDLNFIPIESVERVEVLHDDASAQYGSDAIAGIINIVLKKGPHNEAILLGGIRDAGDGALYSGSYNYGTPNFFLSLEAQHKDYSNTAGLDRRDYYFAGDPRNGDYKVTHRYGDPQHDSISLTFNGEQDLNSFAQVYYLGKYSYRENVSVGFFRRPNDDRNVRAIYPDGFLPELAPIQHDLHLTLGYRYSDDDFTADISNTIGYNRMQINVKNSLNTSLGNNSPTSFDTGATDVLQNTLNADFTKAIDSDYLKNAVFAFGTEYRHERYGIKAGETSSWIDGGATILDGPNVGNGTNAGAQLWPGFKPDDAATIHRNVLGLYGELGFSPLEQLDAKIALRDEQYTDFGNSLNAKGSLDYHATDSLGIHSSISKGYRAPSLQQMGYQHTSTYYNTTTLTSKDAGIYRVDNELSNLLGSQPLKPEESLRYGIGMRYDPSPQWRMTMDYSIINVKDEIAMTQTLYTTSAIPADAIAYMNAHNISGAAYFMNAMDTQTKLLNVSIIHSTQFTPNDHVDLSAQYFHKHTTITALHTPSILNVSADTLFPRSEQERRIHYLPDNKAIFSINYQNGPLSLLTRANYFGSVLYVRASSDPTIDDHINPCTTVDVDLTYNVSKSFELTIGAQNLFNTYTNYRSDAPPFNGEGNIFQYRDVTPFDYTGAFYYTRAVIHF